MNGFDSAARRPEPEPAPDDLRRLFRRHASAVAVITTSRHGTPIGLLVTSLASVSTTPPLISFNVSAGSSSRPALDAAEYIGVHILDAGQHELADRFARRGADRFAAPTNWHFGPHQVPVLDGSAAWSIARIDQRLPVGDHIIVIAELLQADAHDGATPLLHHDGGYRRLERPRSVTALPPPA